MLFSTEHSAGLTSNLTAFVPVSGSSQPSAKQANWAAPRFVRSSAKMSTEADLSMPRCEGTAPTFTPVKQTACGKWTCHKHYIKENLFVRFSMFIERQLQTMLEYASVNTLYLFYMISEAIPSADTFKYLYFFVHLYCHNCGRTAIISLYNTSESVRICLGAEIVNANLCSF